MKITDRKAADGFLARLDFVETNTQLSFDFLSQNTEQRIERAKKDYGYFVSTYFKHIAPDENADFHNTAANKIKKDARIKAVLKWFRGAAKSTHACLLIPLWLWINKDMRYMVLIGAESGVAKNQLAEIQAEFEANQLLRYDFGDQVNRGDWTHGEFVLKDGTKFLSRSRGEKLRGLKYKGRRPDYVVMDDIDDDEVCENEDRIKKLIRWILKAVMYIGDRGNFRVIISNNLISHTSVTAYFSKHKSWWHNQIDAIDGLGNPAWFQKYTPEYYQALRQEDELAFQGEMMHNPHAEGDIFKESETQYMKMTWATMRSCASVVAKWDIAYTNNKSSDYNAVNVVGFKQDKILVFKAYCRQSLMNVALDWMYDIDRQAKNHNVMIEWYAERQFWNEPVRDAVEAAAKRFGYYLEIVMDDTPQTNKIKRIIKGLASYWQMAKMYFNELEKENYDMKTGLGQLWAVDYSYNGKDDYPDSLEATVAKGKRAILVQNCEITLGDNNPINDYI
jgi:hypothetical protein